jgi:hypothetical protein
MRDRIDVHKMRQRYDRAVRSIKSDKTLSEKNKRTILKFTWDLQSEGITLPRLVKGLYLLCEIGHRLKKDFDTRTRILTPLERQAIGRYLEPDGEKSDLIRVIAQRARENASRLQNDLPLIERFLETCGHRRRDG